MPEFPHHIIPTPSPEVQDIFAVYQTTQAFYREVESRDAFEQYCQWYSQVSAQHRRELETMRGDINLLGWFIGSRRDD